MNSAGIDTRFKSDRSGSPSLRRLALSAFASLILLNVIATIASAIPAVWTQHNDNSRSGENTAETVLTPANVNTSTFGKLFTVNLDDQSYSQPLYIPGVVVGGTSHNVVYVTTVNNSVYAIDADAGTQLWHVNLTPSGASVPDAADMSAIGVCGGTYVDFAGNFGIVGTPVINTTTNTIYLVARTIESGAYVQRLHALNIATGAEQSGSPVVITGSANGVNFDPMLNNQRPALALVNGVVYIGWSSHCDYGGYHGFIMGYNASTLAQVAVWADTSASGSQGGIWQGGQGVTTDASNNLYLLTGNGSWDGTANFGESAVKLSTTGGLSVTDYFTPSDWSTMNGGDEDLGASGVLGIPGTSLILGGGKQGILYLMNTSNLGHENNSSDQVVQEFQATFPQNGDTGHIHGGPVYYNSGSTQYIYVWGENDFLRTYTFNGSTLNSTPVGLSGMRAPVSSSGMPGGFLSLSSSGTSNGVLWALTPYNGDANHGTVEGILHAFNALPSNGALTEIWNSQMDPGRDNFGNYAKFTYPTIVNGKVYVSTFGSATSGSGSLVAYGSVTSTTGPYGGTPAAIPGTVQNENYDTGGAGIGYYVTSVNGSANTYRSDGVDLEATTDTGGGYDLGWSSLGQWFNYTVNVAAAGSYNIGFRVANDSGANGTFHLQDGGQNISGSITVPSTGGWQTWATVNAAVTLPAGRQTITLYEDAGGFNLNYMTFSSAAGDAPYGGTPAAVPGTVQNENYDTGGQGVAYNVSSINGSANSYRSDGVDLETTTDTGGGYDLGWSAAGQWFNYTVNVSTAGTYKVAFRVANDSGASGTFHLQNAAGVNLTGEVTAPNTGGWQTWTTVNATVTLPAGQQVLTLYQDAGGYNLNYMIFTAATGTPYDGTPWPVPGTVQNENYDTGGQGVAYNVTSTNGSANSYRSDGIDLEACTDTGGGYDLGWTATGQWFNYTVNVASAGTYTVSFRVAADASTGTTAGSFHVQNAAGTNLTGEVNVPGTGGWQTWTTINTSMTLPAGVQTLTVYQDTGGYNFNYMIF